MRRRILSTKSTVRYTKDFHLYTDLLDCGGPHGYLRIDNDLVTQLTVDRGPNGLSVTIRIPPAVFPILRADIARALRRSSRPFDIVRVARQFQKLRGQQKRAGPGPRTRTSSPSRKGPTRLRG